MSRTIFVALSYHGYGHITQTTPVINALARHIPDLKVWIQSNAPRSILAEHITIDFQHLQESTDFGMSMADSLTVLPQESHQKYQNLHHDFYGRVTQSAQQLVNCKADLVLSNVAYIPLAAAAQCHIPSVAMCSLNWAECYQAYCRELPGATQIFEEILYAYNQANIFLKTEPAMTMPQICNQKHIGPIAKIGINRRADIAQQLNLSPETRLVVVFMGGIKTIVGISHWPTIAGVHYIIAGIEQTTRQDITAIEQLRRPYIDIIASVDALITKPGYGGFTEAACNALPVLYTRRMDWPEEPFLVNWLKEQGRCLEISKETLVSGEFYSHLETLWQLPTRPALKPTGIEDAVKEIVKLLN